MSEGELRAITVRNRSGVRRSVRLQYGTGRVELPCDYGAERDVRLRSVIGWFDEGMFDTVDVDRLDVALAVVLIVHADARANLVFHARYFKRRDAKRRTCGLSER